MRGIIGVILLPLNSRAWGDVRMVDDLADSLFDCALKAPHLSRGQLGTMHSRSTLGQRLQCVHVPRPVGASRASLVVQATFFDHFFRTIKSNLGSFLNSIEDPEKIIDQAVSEMQTDLVRLKQECAKYMAMLKQLEHKYNQYVDEAALWLKRAELALAKGDEELAREALKRKKTSEDLARNAKTQMDNIKRSVNQLLANTQLFEQKVADAKIKKASLLARARTAKSNKEVADLVQGLDTKSAFGAFERMEKKILQIEAEADAVAQWGSPEQTVLDKFAALEAGEVIEDELKALKSNVLRSGSSIKKSLPDGRLVRDAIVLETVQLHRKDMDW